MIISWCLLIHIHAILWLHIIVHLRLHWLSHLISHLHYLRVAVSHVIWIWCRWLQASTFFLSSIDIMQIVFNIITLLSLVHHHVLWIHLELITGHSEVIHHHLVRWVAMHLVIVLKILGRRHCTILIVNEFRLIALKSWHFVLIIHIWIRWLSTNHIRLLLDHLLFLKSDILSHLILLHVSLL